MFRNVFRQTSRSRTESFPAHDSAIAASYSPSFSRPLPDGSRPSVFRIPVRHMRDTSTAGLMGRLLHEVMLDNHLSFWHSVEFDVPRFRKRQSLTEHGQEGVLYAVNLGHELGVCDEPLWLLRVREVPLHCAARLDVHTNLHTRG